MRRILSIALLLMTLMSVSCQRRPFAENTTKVNLVLKVNTDIVNHENHPMPETMRLGLYDQKTGAVRYTDYVGPEGGVISPVAGAYDLVVYNIGTESTQVRKEDNHGDMEAFTSEVSSFLKSQLTKFLEKRAQAQAKAGESVLEEKIVYEPDHLFVGHVRNVEIPVILEGDEDREIVLEVDAHSVVETWKVSVPNVDGIQWVRKVVAIISGQTESHFIGRQEDSDNVVSIYFEMKADQEKGLLYGQFNTFGKHPDVQSDLSLDINVTDSGGGEHHYHFDVDSDFMENPGFHIVVEEEVKVEEPKGGGGGFAPVVDDWDEIKTEINI